MSNSVQQLRETFEIDEPVLVHFRAYGDRPSAMRAGKILEKERAFAKVKFDNRTEKVPYSRLVKVRERVAPKTEEVPGQGDAHTARLLRVVPAAFSALEREPAYIDTEGEPVVPDADPPMSDEEIRAELEVPLPSDEAPPIADAEVRTWLEMGSGLVQTLRDAETACRKEADALAQRAQKLMDASDARLTKAAIIAKQIQTLEGLKL